MNDRKFCDVGTSTRSIIPIMLIVSTTFLISSVQAQDAIYLDTTNLSIQEASQHIIQLAKERVS